MNIINIIFPPSMKYNILILLLSLMSFASCKTLQGLGAKDNSVSGSPAKVDRFGNQPIFMEDVSITPGPDDKKNNKTTVVKNSNNSLTIDYTSKSKASFSIENAQWLQFKYAIITGIPVEHLTNMKLLQSIDSWYGTRYCMGGTTERCIDCSAFALTIIKDVYDLSLPRIAQDQYNSTNRISLMDLQQGDLVFFHTTGRYVSHVGVYVGNNKFVHASTSQGVMISDLNDTYWSGRYIGAGRIQKNLEDNNFDGIK